MIVFSLKRAFLVLVFSLLFLQACSENATSKSGDQSAKAPVNFIAPKFVSSNLKDGFLKASQELKIQLDAKASDYVAQNIEFMQGDNKLKDKFTVKVSTNEPNSLIISFNSETDFNILKSYKLVSAKIVGQDSKPFELKFKPFAKANIVFVDETDKGTKDGSSWQNAIGFKQAITQAKKGQILLFKSATYKIEEQEQIELKSSVEYYGGFNASNFDFNDLTNGRNLEASIFQGTNNRNTPMFLGKNLSTTTYIDGFVFSNANSSSPASKSSVLYLETSSPLMVNLKFSDNRSNGRGTAIYIGDNSSPIILNSKFIKNESTAEYGFGGAVYIHGDAENSTVEPKIINSFFIENKANGTYGKGGAIFASFAQATIINSVFFDNEAKKNGGAIYNWSSNTKIYNSILWNNKQRISLVSHNLNSIYNNPEKIQVNKPKIDASILELKFSILNENSIKGNMATIDTGIGAGSGNNKILDPKLDETNKNNGYLSLKNSSPAIDAGSKEVFLKIFTQNSILTKKQLVTIDFLGKQRIKAAQIDMGAIEFQN